MRKTLAGFVFLALCLAFSSTPAHAQTVVNLLLDKNTVAFVGGAGDTATFSVSATGIGISGANTFNFTLNGGPIGLTETSPSSNFYTVSGGPLNLSVTGGAGSLTGTVDLISFSQDTMSTSGTFDSSLLPNVHVTASSGVLASSPTPIFVLSIHLEDNTLIDTSGDKIFNTGGVGTLTLAPIPEPASMLLFGSGLLAVGGVLRRRLLESA